MAPVYEYEIVTPAPIENTTVQRAIRDGVFASYRIAPNSGYVLHDNALDWTMRDMDTGETTLMLGYTTGTCSCGASYDFAENPREFYAVPADSVPADQIFGVGNDHEVM